MKQRVLITGSTGFIGRHLTKKLVEKGYKVRCLVRKNSNYGFLENLGVEVIYGNISEVNSLKKAVDEIDFVFHLAAITNISKKEKNPYRVFNKINFEGTKNLLKVCNKIKYFVYFSSIEATGIVQNKVINENTKPTKLNSPYGITKHKSEEIILKFWKEKKIPITIIRPAMVYGEGEINSEGIKINSAILKICQMVKKQIFPIIGDGNNKLPLTHVSNVVEGAISIIKNKKAIGQIYILSDKRAYSLKEVVKTIEEIENVKNMNIHLPKRLTKIGVLMFGFLNKFLDFSLPITSSGVEYITLNREVDINKAEKDLNYKPIDLKKGLTKTINWYKQNKYLN